MVSRTNVYKIPGGRGGRSGAEAARVRAAMESHEPPAVVETPPPSSSSSAVVSLEDLECPVCLSLLCEPLTLSCGHSACRVCCCRALQRVPKCPTCRAVCHISPEDHPETLAISRLAKRCFPALYEQRLREMAAEKESWKLLLPIFFYNVPIFPGEVLRLHLFEPRYKLMMQRIVNSTRRFCYVPNYHSYKAQAGDVALIAELRDVRFFRDGRSELEAKIVGRYTIVDHYVEDGTGGLHYCRVKELKDEDVPIERRGEAQSLCRQAREVASKLYLENSSVKAIVLDRFGEMPHSPEALSLWVIAILRSQSREEKHRLLCSTDTIERLQEGLAHMRRLLVGAEAGSKRDEEEGAEHMDEADEEEDEEMYVEVEDEDEEGEQDEEEEEEEDSQHGR